MQWHKLDLDQQPLTPHQPWRRQLWQRRDIVNDAEKILKLKEAQENQQKNMSWYFLNNQKVKDYLKERAISFFGMENVMDRYLLNVMATVAWLGLSELL